MSSGRPTFASSYKVQLLLRSGGEARFIDDKRSATMELYRYRVLAPGERGEG